MRDEWKTYFTAFFHFKNRSRVIKVDAPPKFYNLPLFLLPFIHSSYLPSFPVSFLCPLSFFLPLGSSRSMLPVGSTDNKHPSPTTHYTLGQETPHVRTCRGYHDNKYHLSINPASERTCSKAVRSHGRRVDLGQGSKYPISCPDRRGLTPPPHASPLSVFHIFSFSLFLSVMRFECDWCSVCYSSLHLVALAHPSDY